MTFEEWLVFMAIWTAVTNPLGPNGLNCISAVAASGLARGLRSVVGVTIAAVIHMSLPAFAGQRNVSFDRGAGATYLGFAAGLAFADMRRS